MDVKVVYDPDKGNMTLFADIAKIVDHLTLEDRLVTIYVPKVYKQSQERFILPETSEWYQRIVEYGG